MVACCRILIGCALLATIASTLRVYPHQLAYFNEVASGPDNGPRHLLGSSLDWGQDLIYLREWITAHPEARPLTVTYEGFFDPAVVGVAFPKTPELRPNDVRPGALDQLQPGWHALSVAYVRHSSHLYDYFETFEPVALAGYSIYIFRFTENDVQQVRSRVKRGQ